MDWHGVFIDFGDAASLGRIGIRLGLALLFGGILGVEREAEEKAAGMRTHMLVALGAAVFILVPLELGVPFNDLMRVVEGLTMAIGFIGGGTILKLPEERRIQGLTTAATLWVTAAMGTTLGMGLLWPAVALLVFSLFTLHVLGKMEMLVMGTAHSEVQAPSRSAHTLK